MEYRTQLEPAFLSPTLDFLQINARTFSLSTIVTGNYLLVEAGKDHPSSLPPAAYYQGHKNNRQNKTMKHPCIQLQSADSLYKPLTLEFNKSCD